jgi:acyl transferase domain-containing protein/NADP-dependent 3-hydroxy acid dehydrogenase YdfG
VSSFGISGTNAHVIIEHFPDPDELPDSDGLGETQPHPPVVWTLSARTPAGLPVQARRLHARLSAAPDLRPRDVAHTLLARAALEYRATVVGNDPTALLAGLAGIAEGTPPAAVALGRADQPAPGVGGKGAVFVFPGQGSQWTGMAAELLDTAPVFAERMAECAAALAPHIDWSLDDVVRGRAGAELCDRVDVVQPALFAMMVSLVEVWRWLGVEPAAVIGHSQGEIAAACVAGALTLDDAALVVARRSRALAALAGGGGMVSLPLPADDVRASLVAWGGRLSIAAVNGPGSVVVAGEAGAVEELLAGSDGRARRIPVDYASHSPAVEQIEADLLEVLAGVRPRRSELAFYSTVEAAWVDTSTLDADYWYRNLRHPVEFQRSVEDLLDQGYRVFVEASAHPVLTRPITDTAEAAGRDDAVVAAGTLRRDHGGLNRVLRSAADLHVHGVRIDWGAVVAGGRLVDLPTYGFEHRRYWPTAPVAPGDVAVAGLVGLEHSLLHAGVGVAGTDGLLLTGRVSRRLQPWLADHVVLGRTLVPGTAFVDLAIRAGDEIGFGALAELVVEAPLAVDDAAVARLQVAVAAADDTGRRPVTVHSRPADAAAHDPWTRHASGLLEPSVPGPGAPDSSAPGRLFALEAWPPPGAHPVDLDGFYLRQADAGYAYGTAFQGLRAVWTRGDEVFAEAELADADRADAARFGLHPALLDAALHAGTFAGVGRAEPGQVMLPFAWNGVALHATGATAVRVRVVPAGEHAMSVQLCDQAGTAVASVASLVLRPAAADTLGAAPPGVADALFVVDWTPIARTSGPAASVAATTVHIAADTTAETPSRARQAAAAALVRVQEWLDDPGCDAALLVVATERAVATESGEPIDAALATVWGLLRSAQTEHPDRFVLLDLDRPDALDGDLLDQVLAAGEAQLALRDGQLLAPRLARVEPGRELAVPPGSGPWRLETLGPDALSNLALVPHPDGEAPLGPTEVRVALRAASLDVPDLLDVLGSNAGEAGHLGCGSGVVAEVGVAVDDLRPGDRVLGVFAGSVATLAVTERGLLVPVPPGWDWARAAAVPALVGAADDLAGAGVPHIQALLRDGLDQLARGERQAPPVTCWDIRRAPDAFRHLMKSDQVERLVLTLPRPLDCDGTVLITGGTGLLGGLVAERLVTGHGIRSLVLSSRHGPDAPGAAQLRDRLIDLGAQVTLVAGDVGDPAAVAAMLAAVPASRPLTAVVHAAGSLDDAPVTALNPQRLDAVFESKLDGAWHLHQQTRDLDLAEFIVFSSGAGIFGVAGQANYAAANAFADALAAKRQAEGRPARSLAWGLWEQTSAMTAGLGEIDRARAARVGLLALPTAPGLDLFDAALRTSAPLLVPTRLDFAALRLPPAGARVPALLAGFVPRRPVARPTAGGPVAAADLTDRLAGLPASVQLGHLLELVRNEAAAVLGHGTAEDIDPVKAFSQVGFDSLTAVELRNRLTRATAVRLPATLVYDHPDPTALARHLQAEMFPATTMREPSIMDELDRLERAFAAASVDREVHRMVAARIETLAARWQAAAPGLTEADPEVDLDQATDDELFALIDDEFGLS